MKKENLIIIHIWHFLFYSERFICQRVSFAVLFIICQKYIHVVYFIQKEKYHDTNTMFTWSNIIWITVVECSMQHIAVHCSVIVTSQSP